MSIDIIAPTTERIARGLYRTWIADPDGFEIFAWRARSDPHYGVSGQARLGLITLRRIFDRAHAGNCSAFAAGPGRISNTDGLARAHEAVEKWRQIVKRVKLDFAPQIWPVHMLELIAQGFSLAEIGANAYAPAGYRGAGRALERNRELIETICAKL